MNFNDEFRERARKCSKRAFIAAAAAWGRDHLENPTPEASFEYAANMWNDNPTPPARWLVAFRQAVENRDKYLMR